MDFPRRPRHPRTRSARDGRRGLPARALIALALLTVGPAAQAEGGIPDVPLSYAGTLSQNGLPYDGVAGVQVRLHEWTSEGQMGAVYCDTQLDATVSAGRFEVPLDTSCAPAVEQIENVWLSVTVTAGGETADFGPQRVHAVPYAVRARTATHSLDGVPVGGALPWFSFGGTLAVPDGWVPCDGGTVDDPASPVHGQAVPDLRGRFVRGTGDDGAGATVAEGASGGANTVDVTGGEHNHQWAYWTGGEWRTYDGAGNNFRMESFGDGIGYEGSGFAGVGLPVDWGWYDVFTTHNGHTHPGVPTVPPYVGLTWICRVR